MPTVSSLNYELSSSAKRMGRKRPDSSNHEDEKGMGG